MGFAARATGTSPCPSFSEEQEEANGYRFNIRRDGFAFRKATNARPSRPVSRSKRLLGSGMVVASIVQEVTPLIELVMTKVAHVSE